jgi:trehalose 6-phosphate synthase
LERLVVISNRVGVPTGDGASRAGGLEVAVRAALRRHNGIWFGWSGKVAAPTKVATQTIKDDDRTFVVTDLTKEDYQEYYNGFANRVLWPILHYRLDLAEFTRRDLSGYLRVNDHLPRRCASAATRTRSASFSTSRCRRRIF